MFVEVKKKRKLNKIVIPAKAGIHDYPIVPEHWTPVFTGVTIFYGGVIYSNQDAMYFCLIITTVGQCVLWKNLW